MNGDAKARGLSGGLMGSRFRRLAFIFVLVYALLVCLFYWIVNEDWRHSAVTTEAVTASALLPVMDGETEICQTFIVQSDELQSLTVSVNPMPETGDPGELTARLLCGCDVLREWSFSSAELATEGKLVLELEEPLKGYSGREAALTLTGKDDAAFWYGNTRTAGKFEVETESAGQLTVNGNPVSGELVMTQSGVRVTNYMDYFWPVAILMGIILLALMLYSYRMRVIGKPFFLNSLMDLAVRYRYLLKTLVIRDFKVKYKASVLGVFWSFLNPLLMTLVYMFVFSTIFQNSIPNFTVYVMCGIVLYNYLSDSSTLGMQSIIGNAGLLTKVYIPKYIFPISKAISASINLGISMIPLMLIMAVTGVVFRKSLLLIPMVLILLMIFCIGLALMLSAAVVFFRDVQFLWSIVLMIWNFVSPIFYPESIIPARFIGIYHANPLYQYLYFMRTIVLGGVSPQPVTYLYCLLCSLISLTAGLLIFRKFQDRFVLYL